MAAVVAAAIIGAAIVVASTRAAETKTITVVTTSIMTATLAAPAGTRLYEVIFKQSGACTPTSYAAPWSVTLGPWTVAEPPYAALPINTSTGAASPTYVNSSVITFSVPNGQYLYQVAMVWNVGNPSGVINVNGTDVKVLVLGPEVLCTATRTATG